MLMLILSRWAEQHMSRWTDADANAVTPSSSIRSYTRRSVLSSLGQGIAGGLFQLSRQDREFFPFSLMLRDEIENYFLSVSRFETRSRISVFSSCAPDYIFSSANMFTFPSAQSGNQLIGIWPSVSFSASALLLTWLPTRWACENNYYHEGQPKIGFEQCSRGGGNLR